MKDASDLSVSTRSLGLDSSFDIWYSITGIPLFLAYSAPPQSGINIKERQNKGTFSRQRLKIKR